MAYLKGFMALQKGHLSHYEGFDLPVGGGIRHNKSGLSHYGMGFI